MKNQPDNKLGKIDAHKTDKTFTGKTNQGAWKGGEQQDRKKGIDQSHGGQSGYGSVGQKGQVNIDHSKHGGKLK